MAPEEGTNFAHRLTFEYEGDQVRQIGQQRIAMTTPPSDSTEGHQNQSGFWFEVRDNNEKVLYRRIMQSPIQTTVEVFSPTGTIVRRPVTEPKGVFQLVVPEIPGGTNLVLVGSPQPAPQPMGTPAEERARPPARRVGSGPAQEFARFSLKGGTQ